MVQASPVCPVLSVSLFFFFSLSLSLCLPVRPSACLSVLDLWRVHNQIQSFKSWNPVTVTVMVGYASIRVQVLLRSSLAHNAVHRFRKVVDVVRVETGHGDASVLSLEEKSVSQSETKNNAEMWTADRPVSPKLYPEYGISEFTRL